MDQHVITNYIISGLSVVAWFYFTLDRKSMSERITKKGVEIEKLNDKVATQEKEISTLKSTFAANEKTEELRTELLKQSLQTMEKSVDEIKGNMKVLTETILKHLMKNG